MPKILSVGSCLTPFLKIVDHPSEVGQGILPGSKLKDVFDGADSDTQNDTGLFMVSVSSKHPIFNMVQRFGDQQQLTVELKAKVADLEKTVAAMTDQGKFSGSIMAYFTDTMYCLVCDRQKKPARKKKKNKATSNASGPSGLNLHDGNRAPALTFLSQW